MTAASRNQILITGVDDPVYNAAVNVLSPLGFDVHRAPWDGYIGDHVQITPYDIIMVGLQPAGGAFDQFLKSLRTRGSACHNAGVIIVAPHPVSSITDKYVGRGANKVMSEREVSAKLQDVVHQLIGVAPRVPVTMNARIKIHVKGKPVQSFCQTQNLSESGVLIRGFAHYSPGLDIDFEISLPKDTAPLRGTGTISRRTSKMSEGIDGLGIRFTSFQGADRRRLLEFLEEKNR